MYLAPTEKVPIGVTISFCPLIPIPDASSVNLTGTSTG
jgi:hypothetical protein